MIRALMISVLSMGSVAAQECEYVLRTPLAAQHWTGSCAYQASTVTVSRWWSGPWQQPGGEGYWVDENPCADISDPDELSACSAANPRIDGNLFILQIDGAAFELYVPVLFWFLTDLYAEASPIALQRSLGAWLLGQICSGSGCRIRLGIGGFSDTSPTTAFPDDYWATVALDHGSFGQLKALYER